MTIADESALLTDFYQLTMLQAYADRGMNETAVFEFFVRRLPENRNFLLAAGLEQVLDYLENLHFTPQELDWLVTCGRFSPDFVKSLADLQFTGDVWAMPEGTPFFADEPILRVVAPLREAQLVETRIINLLQFQILIATKAARVRLVAPEKLVVDFGLRRAHGGEAGMLSARTSYLAGFDGSSNVQAGMRWNIPLFGTMAHSFIQAHDNEVAAFEDFSHSHPNATTLLIDTYDTEAAARDIIPLARRLADAGIAVQAVRIDSGDLGRNAASVRAILDAGGLTNVRIFASGNLDEYEIHRLLANQAPIDGFGVGTRMNTSNDCPYLECAYKLQEYATTARRKRSEGKASWPGRKQVYRQYGPDGIMIGDTITLEEEHANGTPLLSCVMHQGKRRAAQLPLTQIRDYARAQLALLPVACRGLATGAYPVNVSPTLHALAEQVDQRPG